MRNLLSAFFSIILLTNSCTKDNPELALEADFEVSFQDNCNTPELEVLFENTSKHAVSFLWDFGDGTVSTETNPKKVYAKQGTYLVSLTAFSESSSKVATKDIYINRNSDGTGPIAHFEIVREDTKSLTFKFINKSQNADFCNWSISPGTVECGDFFHTFPGPGKYVIILYASNAEGTNCHREILDIDPSGG